MEEINHTNISSNTTVTPSGNKNNIPKDHRSQASYATTPFPMIQYLPHPDLFEDDDNRYYFEGTLLTTSAAATTTTSTKILNTNIVWGKIKYYGLSIAYTNPDDLFLAPWKTILLTPSQWFYGGQLITKYVLYHLFFTWTGRIVLGSMILYNLPQWLTWISPFIHRNSLLSSILSTSYGWIIDFGRSLETGIRLFLHILVTFYYENGLFSMLFLLFPLLCCLGCIYCCFSICCDWNFTLTDDTKHRMYSSSNSVSFLSWIVDIFRWSNYFSGSFNTYFVSDRSVKGTPPEPGVVGLTNTGIYCYQNSIYQCLSAIRELTEYFTLQTDADQPPYPNRLLLLPMHNDNGVTTAVTNASSSVTVSSAAIVTTNDYSSSLLQAYSQLLRKLWCNRYTVIAPYKLRNIIFCNDDRFNNNEQQDNQEFLGALLDLLHEHLLLIHKKKIPNIPSAVGTRDTTPTERVRNLSSTSNVETSGTVNEAALAVHEWNQFHQKHLPTIVSKLFRGQQLCRTVCPQCHYVARNFETFMYLPLPLPPTFRTWRLRVISPLVQFPTFTLPSPMVTTEVSTVPSPTLNPSVHDEMCQILPHCLRITVEIPHPSTIGTLRTEIKNILKKYLISQYTKNIYRSSSASSTGTYSRDSLKTEIKQLMDPYEIIIAELSGDGTVIAGVLGNFELTSAYASDKLVIYIIPKVPKQSYTVSSEKNEYPLMDENSTVVGEKEVPTGWTQVIHRMATWKYTINPSSSSSSSSPAYRRNDSTVYENATWIRTCSHDTERMMETTVPPSVTNVGSSIIPIFSHPVTNLADCYELPATPPSLEVNIVRPYGSLPLLIRTVEGMTLEDLRTIVKKWVILCQRYSQGYPSYTTDYDAVYPDGQVRRPYAPQSTITGTVREGSIPSLPGSITEKKDLEKDPLTDYLTTEYVPFLSVTDNIGSECALCRNTHFNIQNRLVDEETPVCLGCSLLDLVLNEEDEAILEAEKASLQDTSLRTKKKTTIDSSSSHMLTVYHRPIPIYTNRWMTVTIDWFQDTTNPLNDNDQTDLQIVHDQYRKLNSLRNRLLPIVRKEISRRNEVSGKPEISVTSSAQTRAESTSSSNSAISRGRTEETKLLSLPDPMAILPQRIAPLAIAGKLFHPYTHIMNEEEISTELITPTLTIEPFIDAASLTPSVRRTLSSTTKDIPTASSTSLVKRQRLQTDSESLNTLYTCLRLYTAETTLSSENLYHCASCKEFVPAKRSTSLTILPEILIFSLKRFIHFDDSGSIEKLDSFIQFPLTDFDVRPWMVHTKDSDDYNTTTSSSSAKKTNTSKKGSITDSSASFSSGTVPSATSTTTVYDLFSVCHHTGALTHGHYISYTMNPITGNWYKYDDNTVTPIVLREYKSRSSSYDSGGMTTTTSSTSIPGISSDMDGMTNVPSTALFTYTEKEQQILEQTLVTKAAYLLFYRKRH